MVQLNRNETVRRGRTRSAYLLPVVLLPAEQLRKTRQAAPRLHKFVIQKFFRRRAAADVDTETDAEERLELLAEFLGLLETRRAVGCDEVQRL